MSAIHVLRALVVAGILRCDDRPADARSKRSDTRISCGNITYSFTKASIAGTNCPLAQDVDYLIGGQGPWNQSATPALRSVQKPTVMRALG